MDYEIVENAKGNEAGPSAYVQEMNIHGVGRKYDLCGRKSLIGRNVNAEIPVSSCNVSRNHAFFEYTKDRGWCITDNRSINGVFLNGRKIRSSVAYPIKSGQKIHLGPPEQSDFWFEFYTHPERKGSEKCPKYEIESRSKTLAKIEATPGHSRSSPSRRENSLHRVRSCQKRCIYSELPMSSQKKSCSSQPDSESTLEERLAAVDSLMKMNKALDKRVKRILNKSDERLNESINVCNESLTQESTSLLQGSEGIIPLSDPPAAELTEDAWWQMTQKGKNEYSQKGRQDSTDNLFCEASTTKQLNCQELCDLKDKVAALEKELKEREYARVALEKELKEKDTLLEEQKQQKELCQKQEEEKLKSNLDEANALQKAVNEEVANQFGKIMESEFTCIICTELFVKATTLDCAHSFCSDCITKWRKNKKLCPICRTSISGMSKSIVIDSFIDKMVEKLSPEDQERRKQVIQERTKVVEKKKPRKKRRPRTAVRRTRQTRVESIEPEPTTTYLLASDFPPGSVLEEIVGMTLSSFTFGGTDSDESPVEGYGYYGGYGRCYNCGSTGHWANGCPEA